MRVSRTVRVGGPGPTVLKQLLAGYTGTGCQRLRAGRCGDCHPSLPQPAERFPAGNYTIQHAGGDGLPKWTAQVSAQLARSHRY